LECRPLLIFAGCAMLFHFANAPLLPLVGQKLGLSASGARDGHDVVVHSWPRR